MFSLFSEKEGISGLLVELNNKTVVDFSFKKPLKCSTEFPAEKSRRNFNGTLGEIEVQYNQQSLFVSKVTITIKTLFSQEQFDKLRTVLLACHIYASLHKEFRTHKGRSYRRNECLVFQEMLEKAL